MLNDIILRMENIEKRIVKESFYKMQEGKGTDQRFPIPGELAKNWEKRIITVKELWDMNPQMYVGYRVDNRSDILDGDSGHLTLLLWRRVYHQNTRVQTMTDALKNLRQDNLPNLNKQLLRDLDTINKDLALICRTPENNDIPETPLILLNERGVLPYSCGQVIDGTRRILALCESLSNGDIEESMPIPIYIGDFPTVSAIAYNAVAFALDNKPLDERVSLLEERDVR